MRLIIVLILIISCQNEEGLNNGTKRAKKVAKKLERETKLPINEKFKTYSVFCSFGVFQIYK